MLDRGGIVIAQARPKRQTFSIVAGVSQLVWSVLMVVALVVDMTLTAGPGIDWLLLASPELQSVLGFLTIIFVFAILYFVANLFEPLREWISDLIGERPRLMSMFVFRIILHAVLMVYVVQNLLVLNAAFGLAIWAVIVLSILTLVVSVIANIREYFKLQASKK